MRCRSCGASLSRILVRDPGHPLEFSTRWVADGTGTPCCSRVEPIPDDRFQEWRNGPPAPAWEEINDVRGRSQPNLDRFMSRSRDNSLGHSDVDILVAGLALLAVRFPGSLHDALDALSDLEEAFHTPLDVNFNRYADSYRGMEPIAVTTEPTPKNKRRIKA